LQSKYAIKEYIKRNTNDLNNIVNNDDFIVEKNGTTGWHAESGFRQ
jgi:hypothetical protein